VGLIFHGAVRFDESMNSRSDRTCQLIDICRVSIQTERRIPSAPPMIHADGLGVSGAVATSLLSLVIVYLALIVGLAIYL
jgi:hypothetical protein